MLPASNVKNDYVSTPFAAAATAAVHIAVALRYTPLPSFCYLCAHALFNCVLVMILLMLMLLQILVPYSLILTGVLKTN